MCLPIVTRHVCHTIAIVDWCVYSTEKNAVENGGVKTLIRLGQENILVMFVFSAKFFPLMCAGLRSVSSAI